MLALCKEFEKYSFSGKKVFQSAWAQSTVECNVVQISTLCTRALYYAAEKSKQLKYSAVLGDVLRCTTIRRTCNSCTAIKWTAVNWWRSKGASSRWQLHASAITEPSTLQSLHCTVIHTALQFAIYTALLCNSHCTAIHRAVHAASQNCISVSCLHLQSVGLPDVVACCCSHVIVFHLRKTK